MSEKDREKMHLPEQMSLQIHLEPKISLLRGTHVVSVSCFKVSHLSKMDTLLIIAFGDFFLGLFFLF